MVFSPSGPASCSQVQLSSVTQARLMAYPSALILRPDAAQPCAPHSPQHTRTIHNIDTSPNSLRLPLCTCLHTTTGTCSLPPLTAHTPASTHTPTPSARRGTLSQTTARHTPSTCLHPHIQRGPSAHTPIPPTPKALARLTATAQPRPLGLHVHIHARELSHLRSPAGSTRRGSALGRQRLPATRLSLRPSFYPISCLSS